MRTFLAVGLVVVALGAGTLITAQTKKQDRDKEAEKIDEKKEAEQPKPKDKSKPRPPGSMRATLANLQLEIPTAAVREAQTFKEVLQAITETLSAYNLEVTLVIDKAAFRDENPDLADLNDIEVRIVSSKKKAPALDLLRQAIRQLPLKAALLVRADTVEIVPFARTSKEYMLNQTFFVDFKDRPLNAALEELSDLTGVTIVLDARAKQKAQTAVTARFLDDVALQDAVRMLTDMAELKVVYLVTGLYVTTPEHAKEMQKELKNLYEPRAAPTPLGGPLGPLGGPPDPGMMFPWDPAASPLAPPLPPSRKRLDPAA